MKKHIGMVLLILVALLTLSSCDLLFPSFEFDNQSSYTVTVDPIGEDSFSLDPGESETITTTEPSIQFYYSPATYVRTETVTGKVTFYDR